MQNENNYYKNNLSPPRLTREDIVKAISGILIVFAFIAVISLFANIGGGSSNDSNPGSNSGGSSSDGSENDSGTTITYNLSGIWHFNANLSYDNELSAEINFTSNDMECSKIIITNTGYLLWVRQEDDMYMQVWSEKNSWDPSFSRIIDFGSIPQTVSKEFYDWFIANAVQPSTQLLTVVNTNNTAETATFTMPSGYTFEQFIGSEYDTSGGKFTFYNQEFVIYDGHGLRISSDEYSAKVEIDIVASGSFYYAGESATRYQLSGQWEFNTNLSYDNEIYADINFTSNDMECSKIIIMNTGYLLWVRQEDDMYMQVWSEKNSWDDDYSKIIDFGSTPQTVSREFYEWFTANAFKYGTGHAGGNGN